MHLLYNFQIIQEQEFILSYQNRYFQYNDGLFDTLIWQNGKIRFLADHLERIKRAMQVLGLQNLPQLADTETLTQQINSLIQQNDLTSKTIRIKINIWRKTGGLFTPETDEANILISVQPQNTVPAIINQADFCEVIFNHYTPLSFFKGPYAANYVQASIARKKAALDEYILLNDRGNISECLVSNIFWIKDHQVFTPSLETGCIAGIMRLNILRACQMLKIVAWEGFFTQTDLLAADAIFTSNVTGLRPVLRIGQQQFVSHHPLLTRLEQLVLV